MFNLSFIMAFVCTILLSTSANSQTTTLASTNPALPAASICPSSTRVPIYQFTLTASATVNLTGLNFTTNSGYVAGDISAFQLYSSTTNNLAGATQAGTTLSTSLVPGLHTFVAFTRSVTTTTRYFWITINTSAAPIANDSIVVPALTTGNLTVSAGTLAGSAFDGGRQTFNTAPSAVTVSGSGTFCGSTTLNATGGAGGTIYWQNTTTNGISTTTQTSSQVVSATGTYYFRAYNGSCWGTQGSAAVTINPTPTITLGSDPSICRGVTSANLTYSATSGTPTQYSIVYSAAALAQGFVNITNAALPANQITLTVPSSAAANTYSYTITVINSANCISNTYSKTISVLPVITNIGAITGPSTVSFGVAGLIYSITSILGANTYTWTLPAGWSLTAGNGSISISCTSGALGQNGNITVTAGNTCGTSNPSSLAVTVAAPTPHVGCNQCHINHSSAGGQLTAVNGNANLCISCHNPAGSASSIPFANSDKAIPGISGNSHAWDKTAINATYQTNMPADSQMINRIVTGSIICSTCHNQHSQTYIPYLRADNTGDAMCKQCHTARNLGRYLDNPSTNRSSHPVGLTYNGADSRLLSLPNAPISLLNSKVECSTCHKVHYANSSDGNILRMTNDENLCKSCHVYKTTTTTLDHKGMTCITCHDVHQSGSNNIYLIRSNINTPNSGVKQVVFTANTSATDFAGGGSFNGVCEACHTLTDHYSNTSAGTSDARHSPSPQKCTNCHSHDKGFAAQTSCLDCHKTIADKPGVGPAGGRRQIVDNSGNGLGTGGDFKRYSHHISSSIPTEADCIKCHYMGDHKDGIVKLLDPDQGYLNVYTYDPLNKAGVENFCLNCHDANGSMGNLTPFSDGVTVPVIDQTMWAASAHKGNANSNTCLICHDNGHGSNKSTMIGPSTYTGPGTGTDLMNEEEGFCLSCHGAAGVAAVKVHLSFNNANTATAFRKHDPSASYRKHVNDENTGTAFGGANRHVECVDCHNPHAAKSYMATTAPTIYNELIGASGVTPTYAGAGAPTGFTFNDYTSYEYEVCFKCHSSFTTLPTYLPSGWTGTADQADALRKLTTGGTNTQIADSRDMAKEFNPANASYHPLMATGTNLNIIAATFQTGWVFTSKLYCTSCHDNTQKATAGYGRGPHGSQNLHILDAGTGGNAGYKTTHSGANTASTDFCSKCHQAASYISGNTNSRFGYHLYHVANKTQEGCYLCHDTHGSEQLHLLNFSRNQSPTICISAVTTNTQAAFIHAAGTSANTCNLTCHGTSHGGGKSYNPAY